VITRKVADYPMEDAALQPWMESNPETAPNASAVAYFFARHLQEKEGGVPMGVIESFWGGTPVEAWMSLRAIGEDPALMPIFSEWAKSLDAWPTATAMYETRLKNWKEGTPKPGKPETGPGGSWQPAGLYNAMIAPLAPYPIKGAIWYQGESNASTARAPIYARAFQGMIRDWRRVWGEGDFPFFFVQLANYKANPTWPDIREAQRQTLSLVNTGMAVTIDVGNPTNIHPTNKQDVGSRLALAARAVAYGEKIEYSGPMYRQSTRDGSALRVWFEHAGGMMAKGGELKGFEVAGQNGKFSPAMARIEGSTVVVSSGDVSAPGFVRYAWADNPECNLYNSAGLPASPFRSE
jgi:sialate O-acetylesterase